MKMELVYASTRDAQERVTASQAILRGLANDGGLFVPTQIPALDVPMEELGKMSYQETAYEVMKRFLTDFTEEELKHCINSAYDSKFDTEEIAPLVEADGAYYLELFHGSTIAFKDMALSILPYLLTTAAKKNHVKNEIVILTATSGDTGKAALAGFSDVPILTNDDADFHNLHPGFRLNLLSALRIAYALPMIDILEELLRKIRPYELTKGSADAAFEQAMDAVINGLSRHGVNGAKHGFAKAIGIMKQVPYDRSHPRPTVLIVGEYLLNFHPGANHDIEAFLEQNGFEIIEARMSDVIQKSYFYRDMQVREYHLHKPLQEKLWYRMADLFFDLAHDAADKIASAHPLYDRPAVRLPELVKESDPIIHHTFDAGEGVLIPGEILHHAAHGCAFVILQPFGCLPNHVVGRGISKRLKELYPDVQILPLDYDPDVSFANIENRLQMLIMNAREQEAEKNEATM